MWSIHDNQGLFGMPRRHGTGFWPFTSSAPQTFADVPADARPAGEQSWVEVDGNILSSAQDLPARMDAVRQRLAADGWQVAMQRDVDTDPSNTGGRYFEMLLNRADPYTPQDAQNALEMALAAENLDYSPLSAIASEVAQQVVQKTITDAPGALADAAKHAAQAAADAAKPVVDIIPWYVKVAMGLAVLGVGYMYVAPYLPKRKEGLSHAALRRSETLRRGRSRGGARRHLVVEEAIREQRR